MRPEQWKLFRTAAKGRTVGKVPVALIVDSPWIPGYLGVSHLAYYLDQELWFRSNRKILQDFPGVIFFPSWWVEYGMAIEPSAVGSRISFHPDRPPSQIPMLSRPEDIEQVPPVNPATDGCMALALESYRVHKKRILDDGYIVPVVAARGPLCLAAFLRGLTEFLVDVVDKPEGTHKLLAFTTRTVIQWLRAQADAISECVEGVFLLDDIPGLLSRKLYLEFAHPYLKQVFDAFPSDWVKVYHNDANTRPFLADLPDLGIDVFNWTHNIDVLEVREKTGGKLCLMGNVPPLEVGVRGSPQEVRAEALRILAKTNGEGIILSVGGGVSPGMPKANIEALASAVAREWPRSSLD